MAANVFANALLTNDLLFRVVFDALSPEDLLRLSRTCRTAHEAVNWYIPFSFNVNRHIAPYFSDPLAFRSLQARTGMLISGSTALQFFSEKSWSGSDLDLYVPLKSKETVCRWVLGEGYTFKPTAVQFPDFEKALNQTLIEGEDPEVPYDLKGIAHIFTFRKDDGTAEQSDGASQTSGYVQITQMQDSTM